MNPSKKDTQSVGAAGLRMKGVIVLIVGVVANAIVFAVAKFGTEAAIHRQVLGQQDVLPLFFFALGLVLRLQVAAQFLDLAAEHGADVEAHGAHGASDHLAEVAVDSAVTNHGLNLVFVRRVVVQAVGTGLAGDSGAALGVVDF